MRPCVIFFILLVHVYAFQASRLPVRAFPSPPTTNRTGTSLTRRTVIQDDCAEYEREYLRLMIIDIAEVFHHAAVAALPLSRPSTEYENGKFFEFFGTNSYEERAIVRHKLDEAARAASGWPNGDVNIYCHAERFPEDERECDPDSDFYKIYSRNYLNEIALCPAWYQLPEYTETPDPNDQISYLMLHLLQNLPYSQTVSSKTEYWESERSFPEWDFKATIMLRPPRDRTPGILPMFEMEWSWKTQYLYFARSLWRGELVGPYRFHDWLSRQWVWMNGTETESPSPVAER